MIVEGMLFFCGPLLDQFDLHIWVEGSFEESSRRAGGQALARCGAVVRIVMEVMASIMVPVMMATLAVVVAYQIESVGAQLSSLVSVIPIFVAVQTIKVFVGQGVGEVARLDPAATRALMFSGVGGTEIVAVRVPTSGVVAGDPSEHREPCRSG